MLFGLITTIVVKSIMYCVRVCIKNHYTIHGMYQAKKHYTPGSGAEVVTRFRLEQF